MAFLATAVVIFTAPDYVNAQRKLGSALMNIEQYSLAFDSTTNPAIATGNSNLSNINMRALKDFQRSFSGTNASWYKADDGGFIAKFKNGDVTNIVAYDGKGNLHHSIRYYEEKQLPREVRAQVKSTYYDYEIVGVSEVHYEDQVIFVILVQDDTTLKTLRVCDGEMDEVQSLKRG